MTAPASLAGADPSHQWWTEMLGCGSISVMGQGRGLAMIVAVVMRVIVIVGMIVVVAAMAVIVTMVLAVMVIIGRLGGLSGPGVHTTGKGGQ